MDQAVDLEAVNLVQQRKQASDFDLERLAQGLKVGGFFLNTLLFLGRASLGPVNSVCIVTASTLWSCPPLQRGLQFRRMCTWLWQLDKCCSGLTWLLVLSSLAVACMSQRLVCVLHVGKMVTS